MHQAKLGIAISLYDKFDDLEILTEIFRQNFEDNYYIVVSCSHPEGKEKIEERGIDVDEYIQADSIDYSPDMDDLKGKIHLISRIFDSIKHSMEACFKNCEYAMHLHADAWSLDEKKLHEIIGIMEEEDKPVAVKGRGLGAREDKFPVGHINDHFLIVDSNYGLESGTFDFNPLDLIPDRGIHTQLMLIMLGKVGWSNVLHYSDNSEQELWDGSQMLGVRPMMYNPKWKFVHIATEDFPGDLGKELQTMYLRKNGLLEGEEISRLHENYYLEESEILKRLENTEKNLDSKLKKRFVNPDGFGRNLASKKEAIENTDKKDILNNMSLRFISFWYNSALKIPIIGDKFKQAMRDLNDPIKSSWPEKDAPEIYSDKVDLEGFPDKYRDTWFT